MLPKKPWLGRRSLLRPLISQRRQRGAVARGCGDDESSLIVIDLAETQEALYRLLRTESAGSAARALLGVFPGGVASPWGGTAAVFPGSELGKLAGSGVTYPWAVWRPLPVGGRTGNIRAVQGTWYIYAAPNAAWHPLFTIATAIEALYGANGGLVIPYGRCATSVGQITPDAAKGGAQTLPVAVRYEALG